MIKLLKNECFCSQVWMKAIEIYEVQNLMSTINRHKERHKVELLEQLQHLLNLHCGRNSYGKQMIMIIIISELDY